MFGYFYHKIPTVLSHLKERAEKVCLNCKSELSGRYCHNCGQENVEPKESAWHLIAHFFSDLFHFDGKFFSTLKLLATRPGFLTEEYVKGRRAAHLNPIRMYLFVSAAFFLFLMSFVIGKDTEVVKITQSKRAKDSAVAANMSKSLQSFGQSMEDSVEVDEYRLLDSSKALKLTFDTKGGDDSAIAATTSYYERPVHDYDSAQQALPEHLRDHGLKHYYKRKIIVAREKWKENPTEMRQRFVAGFFHSLPYVLFLSLPLIALLLKLLYIRRKEFFYVSHAIFTVHFYIFVFITLFLCFLLDNLGTVGSILSSILFWSIYIYLFLAMKRFYKQGGFKTFVKFIMFGLFGTFIISMLAIGGALNTALNVAAGGH